MACYHNYDDSKVLSNALLKPILDDKNDGMDDSMHDYHVRNCCDAVAVDDNLPQLHRIELFSCIMMVMR